jgi:hypothetical protein
MWLRVLSVAVSTSVSVTVILGVTGCGGSDDDIPAAGIAESTVSEDYTLDSSNSNVSIETPYPIDTVFITGSNNLVKFVTIPETISVMGNDNTIYKPSESSLKDSGDGNVIQEQEDSSSAVRN